MQKVTFQSNGLSIHGTLVKPSSHEKPYPGIIIFHGMTSSEKGYIPLAEGLADQEIAGLAISMRGHGESDGDFNKATVAEAINDGIAAYDFLVSQPGIDANRIGLVGSSVGAILAAITSSQRTVQSIVFRAPAAYTTQMMQLSMAGTMLNESNQFHEITDLASTPAGKAITNFSGSLLVIASENDTMIPSKITKGYFYISRRLKQKEYFVIKNAPHQLKDQKQKQILFDKTVEWFKQTL